MSYLRKINLNNCLNVAFLLCSPTAPPKELFCEMKEHKKIIEKGVPEDVPPGLKGRRVSKFVCIDTPVIACV